MMSRPAAMSPPDGSRHKDYNRLKYYSKLRTTILSGVPCEEATPDCSIGDVDFLRPPEHVIDKQLFVLHIPFTKQSKWPY